MPFKSGSQRRWMYANKPAMAKRWSKESKMAGNYKKTSGTKMYKKNKKKGK